MLLPRALPTRLPNVIGAIGVLLFAISFAYGEMPLARLVTIFPSGAQRGTKVEVTLSGHDLDGVDRLWFSNPGISAVPMATGSKFLISIDHSVPPGLYDVRAVGLFGVSNPRTFEISEGNSIVAKGGNTTVQAAVELPADSSVYCVAEANAQHFYRVRAQGRDQLTVDVSTTQIDSRMEPITTVFDSNGNELGHSRLSGEPIQIKTPADGSCVISVHDLLYHGGAEYFYRVRAGHADTHPDSQIGSLRWPVPPAGAFLSPSLGDCGRAISGASKSASVIQTITPPCQIDGQFRTATQRDTYTFDAPAAATYWIEIASERFGQDTSPLLLVQRVDHDPKGVEKISDVQAVDASAVPAAIPEFPLNSRDPVCRLEVQQPGTYRLVVRDLFARDRFDHPAAYRLEIRRPTPDFELVAIPPSPLPEPADSREVPVWTTLVRRGGTAPIEVIAMRRDGYDGPIALHVEGLPPEVSAGPAVVPPGANIGTVILQSTDACRDWAGPITITGVGHTASGDRSRTARPATVSFSEYDAERKSIRLIRSRLCDQEVIGVSAVEASPISIMPTQQVFDARAGGKVLLSFVVKGRAPFSSPVVLSLAGLPAAAGQLNINQKADNASVELDLAKAKLPPGRYTLHFAGQAKFKYADSPDLRAARIALMNEQTHETKCLARLAIDGRALGAAIKLKDSKQAISRAKDLRISALGVLNAELSAAAAESRADGVAAHAPAKDVTVSIYSGAFELNVAPAVANSAGHR